MTRREGAAEHYDVIVVGAGMVGGTFACALNASPLRVALIEANPPPASWPPDGTDLRVSAVTLASQRIFTAVGAWGGMAAQRVSPFREMRVWDAGGNGKIHFDGAQAGEAALGYIIENRVMQHALLEQVRRCENVRLHCPAAITRLSCGSENAQVVLQDGTALTARLIVGADGAESKARRLAGIAVHRRDYEQKAVVTTVETARSHRETAWQRFLPTGPLAFLPLWDGRSSIVWSTTPAHALRLCALEAAAFNRELEEAFDSALGAVTHSGQRAAFVLRRQHADVYTRPRLALIGDAAHTVHPLAGQGVNLGLLDAAALAEVVRDAADAGRDIGAAATLRRYERWRKGDNLLMMAALDGFKQLFGAQSPPLRQLRNLGMNLFDHSDLIKNRIMYHAMGLRGDLPRIAR